MATMTIQTALTQYNENLDWDTSVTNARLALSALRFLRVNMARGIGGAGHNLSFSAIDEEIKAIEEYLNTADTSLSRISYTSARSRWV